MPITILFNKPFNVLSQFTDQQGRLTLADFIDIKQIYAAGRLDRDSEGLMVLTSDGRLNKRITDPRNKMWKTYWAQVEGQIDAEAIARLRSGVVLKDGKTKPAKARSISEPESLWQRDPPIRKRQNIPTSWLELEIAEGKNRQVRRMTAAVGFPTLRLIRCQIGPWKLGTLKPGEWIEAPAIRNHKNQN
ncbi:MAG: pseudouridine synthase [Pseudomonadales bacterium]|jgi:23S rRNA pseudouridine2457 synthase|nr:pseudouridine synthase [Pseudomonadales bacterium]